MSPADNADALTPLMRLRRRRKAFRVFGTLLILALLLLAGIVLAVNQGRNFHRMVDWLGLEDYLKIMRPAASEAPKRYRLSRVAIFPRRLVLPNTDEASAFNRFPSQAAYERCRQLSADSTAMASFQASGDDWECVLSRELGSTPEPSVLFIQARGTSPDSFRTFRAKLSLLAPSQNTALMRLALDSLDRFGLALSPQSRRYVEERMTMRRNFSSLLENYRITFERERDDEKRFNMLIVPLSTMTTCTSPRVESEGTRMSASIAPMRLGCLSLNRKPPASGQSVKPD